MAAASSPLDSSVNRSPARSSHARCLILVEWESKDAFDGYCNDPELTDLHAHRENGSSSYIWHLFDRLDDLRPLLKP